MTPTVMNQATRRIDPSVLWPAAFVGGLIPLLAAIEPLLRYDRILPRNDPWSAWQLTPGITLCTLLVALVYIAGQRNPVIAEEGSHQALRHLSFFGGVAAIFLALQSPIEPISDHLFIVHQVEHMLLRTAGPMLIMLSAPQAALLRGLPNWARRGIVRPLLGSRTVRLLGVLGNPVVATVLFVGTTYFWMIPRYHDIAILNENVHYVWHTTLLLSGLIFFWRILDQRPYPLGAALGTRLCMFWFASIGNILLGSYLSFKHQVLYQAYGELGRLWGISPATDEQIGGLTMWIPGSMMFAITAMLMIYRWAQQEDRTDARARARGDERRTTSAEFFSQRQAANRKMALGLVGFLFTVLTITFTIAAIYRYGDIKPALIRF